MNTRNTTTLIRHDAPSLARAIELLDVLRRPAAHAVLQYLNEHACASYIDLLVAGVVDYDDLDEIVHHMTAAGILMVEASYGAPEYRINETKLARVWLATRGMKAEPALVCGLR